MKFHKLTLNAIGPYLKEITIDFDELSEGGLFLVYGPTGSGKTTLFDALTFALFGEASGENRKADTLKSQFASDEESGFVSLSFSYQGVDYFIKRHPAQTRPTKRGLIRYQNQEVTLESVVFQSSSITEVNEYITDLLSLNSNQFKMIVMLAQGEFQKMLFASSRDKEMILRQLFKTQHIQSFQDLLSSQTKKYRELFKQSQYMIQTTLSDGPVDDTILKLRERDLELKEAFELIKLKINAFTEELNALNKTKQSLTDLVSYEEVAVNLEKQAKAINEKREQLLKHEQVLKLLPYGQRVDELLGSQKELISNEDSSKQSLNVLEALLNHKKEQLKVIKPAYDDIDKEYQVLSSLNLQHKEQLKLKEDETLLKEKQKVLSQLKKEADQSITKIEATKKSIDDLVKSIDIIHQAQNKLLDLNKEKTAKIELISNQQEKIKINERIHKLENDIDINEKKWLQDQQELKRIQTHYQQQYHYYQLSTAGFLALNLQENEPCPVCGSVHHPQKAAVHPESLTQQEIEKLEEEMDTHRVSFERDSVSLKQMRAELEELLSENIREVELGLLKQDFEDQKSSLDGINEEISTLETKLLERNIYEENLKEAQKTQLKLDSEYSKLQTKIEVIKHDIGQLEQVISERAISLDTNYQQLIIDKEKEIAEIKASYVSLNDDINTTGTDIKVIHQQLSDYQVRLSQTQTQLDQAKGVFEKEKGSLQLPDNYKEMELSESQINLFKEEISKHDAAVSENNHHLQRLKQETKDFDKTHLDVIQRDVDELEKTLNNHHQEQQSNQKESAIIDDTLRKVESELKKSKEYEKQYTFYEDLASIASGRNVDKISFERYLLAVTFEKVLQHANIHLQDMTTNRYHFLIATESKGGGAKGLDIDVMDTYSGQSRGVTTLSGGEQFKAALALALGLSDVMVSTSGGIEISALFVDEGFGSLDSDSLDSAINTLMTLNEGGRLVGIVSHVQELRTRIPNKIEIIKTSSGSSLLFQKE